MSRFTEVGILKQKDDAHTAGASSTLNWTTGEEIYKIRKYDKAEKLSRKDLENEYVLFGYLLDSIAMALDGEEPRDLAMSFGIVREVWELKQNAKL